MKRFLSLVLALVMTMSLVTISAGAKDFTDNDTITYGEAVAVVSTVGIVDGYADGKFNPTNTLTRQAAAKIICNLILGPTTAAELHADTAPYKDVPVNSEFAGYIAYCQSRGIISGYRDGTFRPGGTLTGYAFMKMLLGALGYDSEIEHYTGDNWSINVAKQALAIGLNKGLDGDFNGLKAVTREEACLYAFRTLQADLVDYDQKITATVGGAVVTVGTSQATSRKWTSSSQQTRINNIREDDIIQFAEEHFRKLEKKVGEDEFERPAYTWVYDKEEIGTFVDWDLMVEEYHTAVSGRDLYDLLGSALLNDEDMDLVYYFNGDEPDANTILPAWVVGSDYVSGGGKAGQKNIDKASQVIRRNNQEDVGFTDDGVLTQVFVDKDVREKIIITSIDTWLSKAGADYNESTEVAPMEVWTTANQNTSLSRNVDVEDVPEVADVTEDTFYLMSISFKDDTQGAVVEIWEPEILEESVVTKFSVKNNLPTKLTVGGTEYKKAAREYYDPTALFDYNDSLLTDRNYNVILDQFGYVIGIELNEGAKNYVFITGFDRPQSNLSIKTADAAAIFLDGTMKEIKVNVTQSDKNINAARGNARLDISREYFLPWQEITTQLGQDGFHALNRWFTYTTNDAGVYTLKPATRMVAYYSTNGALGTTVETLKTDNLYLDDNIMGNANNDRPLGTLTTAPYANVETGSALGAPVGNKFIDGVGADFPYSGVNNERCYGNDDSVYITVETDIVDTLTGINGSITGVTGVYTGAQSVEIELDRQAMDAPGSDRHVDEADVYAVYDNDHFVIGAVTVGEANGGNATIAYVTGTVKSERIENGIYYWEFDAIVDGTEKTLTVKENYGSVLDTSSLTASDVNNEADGSHEDLAEWLDPFTAGSPFAADSTRNWNAYDGIVELRFDADDYVVSVKPVAEKDVYSYYGNKYVAGEHGNSSITTADALATPGSHTGTMDSVKDARVYRIGGVRQEAVLDGTPHLTWSADSHTADFHHYDSAPEVLTLKGRTLYVTTDQRDEGLALTSDAKAVVIQRENGKWKTREFNNVSSAIAQVADADRNSLNGKQFLGEVVAVMNDRAQATWLVITSYANLVSGGNVPSPGVGAVNNVAVQYIDVDQNGSGAGINGDEYTAFKLYNTTAGRKYTVTMYTSFGGVTTTRVKVVTGTAGTTLCNSQTDGFYGKLDAGTQITITCEEGVGTYVVPADGSLIGSCTL